ncbi:hypothetical protein PAHAL_7G031300 [Panicum hallii]|uniref:Uncharacterized protein n=1 Tax=Panicum hallii TaxID=206008 RepID=A0A2T8IAV4_9POAL|nr:hypothetical protein PAHAL_7G031300 [Panicum hallii]
MEEAWEEEVDDSCTLVPLAMRQKGVSCSSSEMLLKSFLDDLVSNHGDE